MAPAAPHTARTASLPLALLLTATVLAGLCAVPGAQAIDLVSLSPTSGSTNGGTIVKIVGSDFQPGARVTFGGVEAPYAVVVDDASEYDETSPPIDFAIGNIKATTPPRATTGAVTVTVTNPDGSSDSIASGYTYTVSQTPSVTSLDIISGTTNGGTAIEVTGSNFGPLTRDSEGNTDCATLDFEDLITPLPRVDFGATPGTQVCVETATEISVVTPAHASGAVTVKVTNPDGKSGSLNNGFTYANAPAPTILSVSPASVTDSSNGGPEITIVGSGFVDSQDDLTLVTFGGARGSDVDVTSPTTLTVTLPAHAAGAVDVVVHNPDGQFATKSSGFLYESDAAPVLDTVEVDGLPSTYVRGSVLGGTTIVLQGSQFEEDAVVTVGGKPAEVLDATATEITALTPPGTAGAVDVKVQNPDGQISTLAGGFTYFTPLQATAVSPIQGSTNGGTAVTVTGVGFATLGSVKPRVFFGDAELEGTVTAAAPTTITVTSPPFDASGAASAQVVDIRVVNPDGTTAILHSAYTFVDAALPAITKVAAGTSEAEDGTNGGATITITGTNFAAGAHKAAVVLDDGTVTLEAKVLTVSSTSITFTVPPHPDDDTDAEMDVVVVNPDGRFAVSAGDGTPNNANDNDGFQYTDDDGAPTVSSVTPTTTNTNGGAELTITGSGFAPAAGDVKPIVEVAGVEAKVNSAAAGSIKVVIPAIPVASAGLDKEVVVTNPNGLSDSGNLLDYTAAPAPSVDSLNVPSGSALGRTALTITGSGFPTGANKPTVTFGGQPADVGTVTATTIAVTTPAHAVGGVEVVVTNPDGQSASLPAYTYTSHGSVSVSGLSPASYNQEGGDMLPGVDAEDGDKATVTVSGNNFAKSATVRIGDAVIPAGEVTVVSATQLTVTLPSADDAGVDFSTDDGLVSVTVTNVGSGSQQTLANGFRYLPPPPTFGGVAPASRVDPVDGGSNGGNGVLLTGMDFSDGAGSFPASSVAIGGLDAFVVAVDEGAEDQIVAVAPPHAAGEANVQVFDAFGQSATLRNAYEYFTDPAPSVQMVEPSAGPAAGGSLIAVRGTGFSVANEPTVTVGGVPASAIEVVDSDLVLARTPAHVAAASDVKVTNADGQASTLAGAFTFLGAGGPPAPTISTVEPGTGTTAGGTTVTLTGTNFVDGATVSFGGTAATTTTFVSSTQVTAVTPAHAAGAVGVTLTNADGGTATKANGFTYVSSSTAPSIAALTPACGAPGGGTTVTVSGTNFVSGATVSFGGTAATEVDFVSATSIEAVTPAHAAGAVAVLLTNPDGQSDTLEAGFEYADECDATPPSGILVVTSDTHEEGEPTESDDPAFEWNALTDGESEVTYHYVLNQASSTVVSLEDEETSETSASFTNVADGTWYFHVRAFSDGGAGDQDDYQIVIGEGTSTTDISDEDIEEANQALAESVEVTRDGDDNIVSWEIPDDTPADPAGVQVWSSNSPWEWLATFYEGDDEYESSTFVDEGAPKGTKYLVTLFYADGVGFGDESGEGDDIPGFTDLEAASIGGGDDDIPLWVWILIAGAVLLIVLIVIAVAVSKRKRKDDEAAATEGYAWEDQPPAPVATAADTDQPAPAPEPVQEHAMQCPNCKTTFKATGARPLTTVCPGCGKKGILR